MALALLSTTQNLLFPIIRLLVFKSSIGTVPNYNCAGATIQVREILCTLIEMENCKSWHHNGSLWSSGMGPVHMNEVECSGFEKSITECSFNKESLGCSHEEDAGVRCNVPAMGFQQRVRGGGLDQHCPLASHHVTLLKVFPITITQLLFMG